MTAVKKRAGACRAVGVARERGDACGLSILQGRVSSNAVPPSIRISLVAAQVVAAATLLRSVAYDRWITVLMATLLIAGAASGVRPDGAAPAATKVGDVPEELAALPFKDAKARVLESFEPAYLRALLVKHNDNITRSAAAAGLTRYHLRELCKRYGLRDTDNDPE